MSQNKIYAPTVTRRTVLKSTVALTIGVCLPQFTQAQNRIRSTIFGGVLEEQYRRHLVEPFKKKHGVDIDLSYGSPAQWLTSAVVNRKNPEIDLLWLIPPESFRVIAEDICIELTPEDIPNINQIYPIWYDGYRRKGIGWNYAPCGIAYRTDMVEEPPTSWTDLWKPEYEGRLGMPDLTGPQGYPLLVVAARLNGGSIDNIDPGLEAFKRLRPNVRKFYKSNVEGTQMLERGEVAACALVNNRVLKLADTGVPVAKVDPEEGAIPGLVSYHIPKGTTGELQDICKEFINFAISVEVQEAFCNAMYLGPANTEAQLSSEPAKVVPDLDALAEDVDWFKILPNMNPWLDRWQREVLG